MTPPRRRTRAAPEPPRQPYPPATDFVEPDVTPEDDEPSTSRSEYEPTIRDVSEQIAAQSRHIVTLHRESALMHHTMTELDGKVDRIEKGVDELRTLVVGDHAPRITAVERRPHSIPPPVAKAGKITLISLAAPALLQLLSAVRPDLQGPIELIVKLFGGG